MDTRDRLRAKIRNKRDHRCGTRQIDDSNTEAMALNMAGNDPRRMRMVHDLLRTAPPSTSRVHAATPSASRTTPPPPRRAISDISSDDEDEDLPPCVLDPGKPEKKI